MGLNLLSRVFLGLAVVVAPLVSPAENACKEALAGASFLHQTDKALSKSFFVEAEQERLNRKGQKTSQDSARKINAWIKLLERTHFAGSRDRERMKNLYLKKHITKAHEVPESYFNTQIRLARELGHGTQELTDDLRRQLTEVAINDQTTSLSLWLDHFLFAEEMRAYPMWLKYWAFNGMLKLGVFEPELGRFSKRSKGQVAPFADLNHEAIGLVMNAVLSKVNKTSFEGTQDKEFLELLENSNFSKLYARSLVLSTVSKEHLNITEGQWVKFEQGSDPKVLVATLRGRGTGWCTACLGTAETQLKAGDFHVFYTKDSEGKYTIPRLAIRKEREEIAEVRGIGKDQNLDAVMAGESILEDKLKEFGQQGEAYKKKSLDMKRLTDIEKKHLGDEELNREELRFLYEIDHKITGFGYKTDPRIREIKDLRSKNELEDYAKIFDVDISEVTDSKEVALRGEASVFVGDFDYKDEDLSKFRLIGITRSANFESLTDASELGSLTHIGLNADFRSLKTNARGLNALTHIGGHANFGSLRDASELSSLTLIGFHARFDSLTDASGLNALTYIGREAHFSSLMNASGLNALTHVGESAYFGALTNASGLSALNHIGGDAHFDSLTDASDLSALTHIGGLANFNSLTDARGLSALNHIGGSAKFISLRDASELSALNHVGGNARFDYLTNASGLSALSHVGWSANFDSLTDASELSALNYIGEGAHFPSLIGYTWSKNSSDNKGAFVRK